MSRPDWNTAPIKCANRKCDWTGMEADLDTVDTDEIGTWDLVCPKCGCKSYSFIQLSKRL